MCIQQSKHSSVGLIDVSNDGWIKLVKSTGDDPLVKNQHPFSIANTPYVIMGAFL